MEVSAGGDDDDQSTNRIIPSKADDSVRGIYRLHLQTRNTTGVSMILFALLLPSGCLYRLRLKVGKNLQHRLVDFRQYATLFVASCLSNYPDHLYSE
jgi:hypothetical protein